MRKLSAIPEPLAEFIPSKAEGLGYGASSYHLSANKGVVLILTFIIMATLTAITTGFLFMTSSQLRGSAYDVASSKALWIAEAALQQAIYQIKNDSDYRDSPTTIDANLGDGSYSVSANKNGATYTLTSTGTVDTLNRKVTQSMDITIAFSAAFDYALFGNTNSSELDIEDDVAISGDVYYDGDVEVEEDASVTNGLVYADSVTGDGTYTEAPGPPDPVPTYPAFDTSWYDSQITTAESQASSNWTLDGSDTYNLNGGTVYYKEVNIKNNATITGSGTIVATKDVTIQDNANISSNVTIITKKNLTVKENAIIQSEAVLYARKDITLKDDVSVTGSLLAPENNKIVIVKDDAIFTGIIYADIAKLRDDAVISGSVVANEYEGDKIKDDVSITYVQSSLPSSLPTGMQEGNVTITPQNDWDEIPAT